mgnify:CR=1 FL=1
MKTINLSEILNQNSFTKKNFYIYTLHCLLGSLFLGLMAQFSITLPFTPIPITMQSLALFLLIIAQGKSKATGSVLFYLIQATLGFPVLHMGIPNPLWMIGPTGGYLIGFVAFTLIAGMLLEKRKTPGILWIALSLTVGNLLLLSIGTLHLAFFVGIQNAFQMGFAPFIIGSFLKIICACCASVPITYGKSFLNSFKLINYD